jgi:Spy/CpxP family protein refolding chaperone
MTVSNSGSVATWLVIGGVFAAGALGGAAVTSSVSLGDNPSEVSSADDQERPRESTGRRRGPPDGVHGGSARFIRHLEKNLELTPDQSTRIGVILEEREHETHALFETIQEPMREALQRTEAEIHDVLDDEQRVKFDELVKEGRGRRGGSRGSPRAQPTEPSAQH